MPSFTRIFAGLCFLLLATVVTAADLPSAIDWNQDHWKPLRQYYDGACDSFLCPNHLQPDGSFKIDGGMGIPLAPGRDLEGFKQRMSIAIKDKGIDGLKGSMVVLAGIDMDEENLLRADYEKALEDLGFNQGDIHLRIWSIPGPVVYSSAKKFASSLWKRTKYWFYSSQRDYEKPLPAEVKAGILVSAIAEAPNVMYLFDQLKPVDFSLTIAAHLSVLTALTVYTKTLTNWLIRPGSGKIESYLKQLSLSATFIGIYSVFPHSTEIFHALQADLGHAISQIPSEVLEIVVNMGITAPIQTLLYSAIITWQIGGWVNRQSGLQNSHDARVFQKYAPIPVLAGSALLLARASGPGAQTLMELGPLAINDGHVGLMALTAAGWLTYKVALDPSFYVFKWFKNKVLPRLQKGGRCRMVWQTP